MVREPRHRRARARIQAFWRELTDGLTLQELWTQFRRETGQSYRLYSSELGRRFEAEPDRLRHLGFARALIRAMVLKLSPARRLVLLLAFVLVVVGWVTPAGLYAVLGTFLLIALLGLELADRVAMKRDLQIAREIQGWLLPHAPPVVPGYAIAFTTRPANTVAGDYYDAFLRPSLGPEEVRWMLVVADVAGKGMPAALLMASFQSSLHAFVQEALPLAEVVRRLNAYCCAHSLDGSRFTTAVLAQLDPAAGELEYVNAGHNPPLLRRAGGNIESLDAGGLPLGIRADEAYAVGRLRLARGDVLACYTDGVVDARGPSGEEYGDGRLRALLGAAGRVGAEETLARIMAAVEAHTGDAPRADDETCLVLSVG